MTTAVKVLIVGVLFTGCAAKVEIPVESSIAPKPITEKELLAVPAAGHHCFGNHIPSVGMWCQDQIQECSIDDNLNMECTESPLNKAK